jgi:hypothetical protein
MNHTRLIILAIMLGFLGGCHAGPFTRETLPSPESPDAHLTLTVTTDFGGDVREAPAQQVSTIGHLDLPLRMAKPDSHSALLLIAVEAPNHHPYTETLQVFRGNTRYPIRLTRTNPDQEQQ